MEQIAVRVGQLEADLSATSVTIPGETRTPTAAIVLGTRATSLDSLTNEAAISIGFTDFTTQTVIANCAEHGVTTTYSSQRHDASSVLMFVTPGATTLERSATISATTGGATFSPDDSGSQYYFVVIFFFEVEAIAFSDGNGTVDTGTFSITHGLSGTPNLGFLSGSQAHNGSFSQTNVSLGVFTDDGSITQRSLAVRAQNSQADGENHGLIQNDAVCRVQANSTAALNQITVTANNGTSTTFTNSGNTIGGEYIGLLLYLEEATPKLYDRTAAVSADSNWKVTSSVEPQAMLFVMSNLSFNSSVADDGEAGSFGIAALDTSSVYSVAIANENGATPTDTANRISTAIYLLNDNNTVDYDLGSVPGFSADGVTFLSASIDNVDASAHQWLAIVFEAVSASTANAVNLASLFRGMSRGHSRGMR